MAFIGISYDLQNVVGSSIVDGFTHVQPDAYGETRAGVEGAEQQHSFGFMARPIDPEKDADGGILPEKSCALLFGQDGNSLHAWNGMDPRYIPNIPELRKGENVRYGGNNSVGPAFDHIDENGSRIIYVPVEVGSDGVPTTAHQLAIGKDGNGAASVTLQHSDGMAQMMFEGKNVMRNIDGTVYIELSATEAIINGNTKLNGAIVLGNQGSVTVPIPVPAPAVLTRFPELAAAFVELILSMDASLVAASKGQVLPVVPPVSLAAAATVFVSGN